MWKWVKSDSKVWRSGPISPGQSLLVEHLCSTYDKSHVKQPIVNCALFRIIAWSSLTNSGDRASPLFSSICFIVSTHAQKTESTGVHVGQKRCPLFYILQLMIQEGHLNFRRTLWLCKSNKTASYSKSIILYKCHHEFTTPTQLGGILI